MYCVASCGRGGRRAAVPRALITDGRTITPGDKNSRVLGLKFRRRPRVLECIFPTGPLSASRRKVYQSHEGALRLGVRTKSPHPVPPVVRLTPPASQSLHAVPEVLDQDLTCRRWMHVDGYRRRSVVVVVVAAFRRGRLV